MVVDRHRKHFLGMLLTDHILIQDRIDFLWHGQTVAFSVFSGFRDLFTNDVVAQLHTLIADKYGRTGN